MTDAVEHVCCLHRGRVFRSWVSCCDKACKIAHDRLVEGAPEPEEKTHGPRGKQLEDGPIFSGIDGDFVGPLLHAPGDAHPEDFRDLLAFLASLDNKLKAAPPAQSPILVVRR